MNVMKITGNTGYVADYASETPKAADTASRKTANNAHGINVANTDNHDKTYDPGYIIRDSGVKDSASKESELFEAVLEELRQELETEERQVNFSYNNDLRQMVVTVADKKSGEVVRQVPEEYVLKMIEKFQISGRIEGLLINDKV